MYVCMYVCVFLIGSQTPGWILTKFFTELPTVPGKVLGYVFFRLDPPEAQGMAPKAALGVHSLSEASERKVY